MSVTEDTAKKLWCPFVRKLDPELGTSSNRTSQDLPKGRCLGSDCMAWRWNHEEADETGYCGLAGKP